MIKITPAILTNNFNELERQLSRLDSDFNSLDIDVIRRPFVDNETLTIRTFLKSERISAFDDLGIHLMVEDYMGDINLLLNSWLRDKKLRIYVHQEVDLKEYLACRLPKSWNKCLSVKAESSLMDIEFYKPFEDIQLMTIPTGFQGSRFIPDILERSRTLKEGGYEGEVSIDGGVNLETADLIKLYPIDRVSVGSYFVKARGVQKAYELLDRALNDKLNF